MIFLGLDVGSTGCKCVAFRADGEQLSLSYREYAHAAGHADMDPAAMEAAVLEVIGECTASIDRSAVAGIAITSFGEACVAVDRDGRALSRFMMYTDQRGRMECGQLIEKIGEDRLMEITCEKPDAMYSLPKIMWTVNNVPGVREKVWKFLQVTDYLCFLLSGEATVSANFACRTMAYDVAAGCWSREILDAAGIPVENMPAVVPPGSIVGTLRPALADKLGLPASAVVVNTAQDQVAASVGAGVLEEGQAVDGTGSVECVTPIFGQMIRDPRFHSHNFVTVPHAVPGKFCTYAFNFSGGVLLKWFRDCFAAHLKEEAKQKGVSVYRLLDERCPATPSDLIVVPHFLGAGGTPDLIPEARGTISGMTMQTTLDDLYRAVMEGLTFEIAYNMEWLKEFGIPVHSLMATGGGAASPLWRQIKADILGCPITPLQTDQAGAAGCAMMAATACGVYASLREAAGCFVKPGQVCLPDPAMTGFYREKYQKYREIRGAALEIWK